MKRLVALGLSLALLFGLTGAAVAATPQVPTDPVVVTDPVIPVVVTDPVVPVWSRWLSLPPPLYEPPEVETTGSGLVGTYVGAVGARRYIPAFQYQLIYSDPQGGYSCSAYSAAMAIDKANYGGSQVTGRQVRALSGAPPYAGLTLPDVIGAAGRLYVSIVNRSGQPWASVLTDLRSGRGVILQGDYDQIPDRYSGQVTFDGNHAVYIDYLHSTGCCMYVMDPLRKAGPQWIPVSIMRKYAEKLARSVGAYPGVFYAVIRPARLFR